MMGLQHLQEDLRKSGASPQRIETVEDAIESCEIAVKTLNNMLLYDKIETKLLVLDKEPVLVMPIINKIIQLFRTQVVTVFVCLTVYLYVHYLIISLPFSTPLSQAVHLKVNLSVTYLPSTEDGSIVNWNDLTIYADAEKLAQVVRNVISNALKFTPRNGYIAVEVRKISGNTVTTTKTTASESASFTSSESIQIRVTDTGAGISLVTIILIIDYNY